MDRYLPAELRQFVMQRADDLCEYCLIHEEDTFVGCQVDHVISLKHGGRTEAANLAYACACCNRNKGSDIGSIIWRTREFVRFFNPRTDRWADHFYLEGPLIHPRSDIGEATIRILGFNTSERVVERATLMIVGAYPSLPALIRIRP